MNQKIRVCTIKKNSKTSVKILKMLKDVGMEVLKSIASMQQNRG